MNYRTMKYNLRKRINNANYNVDKVYERIFEDCDEEVKECVFGDDEMDCEEVNECEYNDQMECDEMDCDCDCGETIECVPVVPSKEYLIAKIKDGLAAVPMLDDVLLILQLYMESDEKLVKFKETEIQKLHSFIEDFPEHKDKWVSFLKRLGAYSEQTCDHKKHCQMNLDKCCWCTDKRTESVFYGYKDGVGIVEVPKREYYCWGCKSTCQPKNQMDVDIKLPNIIIERCKCGATCLFGSECGSCFVENELSVRLCAAC